MSHCSVNRGTEPSQLHTTLFSLLENPTATLATVLSNPHQLIMAGPHPKTYMGWWGSLGSPKQKYVNIYTVSPYATRPLKGALHNSIFNTFRRFKNQVLYVAIPAAIVWTINSKATEYNEYLYTKAGREELEKVNV